MENNPAEIWSSCLKMIRDNVTQQQYDTWFEYLTFHSYENKRLVLSVPSAFVYEFIEHNYLSLLKSTITKFYGKDTKLSYNILEDKKNDLTVEIESSNRSNIQQAPVNNKANLAPDIITPSVQELDSQLNFNLNFENFIEGRSNKLARSVGMAIANNPSQTFNPLFLYGASGVGKTHLVNAIGIKAKELHPAMRVLYVSAHLFQVQYTDSVVNNKTNEFINFYQTIDMLIIDDVQELSGRLKTQQTFFHIFNHLKRNGKQIILTADRPPVAIVGLEDRLLTRFKWGLQAELEKPDTMLRKSIVADKVKKDGLSIPNNVIEEISEKVTNSIRDIEGIIHSLLAHSVVENCEINTTLLEKLLPNFVEIKDEAITSDNIINNVCNYFNTDKEKLCSSSRKQPIAYARQIAIYLTNKHTNKSTTQIGKLFGNRNHATIIYSINQVKNLIDTDDKTKADLEKIEQMI